MKTRAEKLRDFEIARENFRVVVLERIGLLFCMVIGHSDKQIHGYAYYWETPNIKSQRVLVKCQCCGREEETVISTFSTSWGVKRKIC